MIKIYLAAPIFSESDRLYNEMLACKIEKELPQVDLYVPQRNKDINDKTKCATAEDITKGDFDNNLDHADIVVARVDGDVPPIGTTLEIGYFCRRCQEDIEKHGKTNKRIFSLYTDSREPSHTVNDAKVNMLHEFAESQFSYINLLLVGALKRYGEMFYQMNDLVASLKAYVEKLEESMTIKPHTLYFSPSGQKFDLDGKVRIPIEFRPLGEMTVTPTISIQQQTEKDIDELKYKIDKMFNEFFQQNPHKKGPSPV